MVILGQVSIVYPGKGSRKTSQIFQTLQNLSSDDADFLSEWKKLEKSFLAFEVVHFTRDQNDSPMAYFSI